MHYQIIASINMPSKRELLIISAKFLPLSCASIYKSSLVRPSLSNLEYEIATHRVHKNSKLAWMQENYKNRNVHFINKLWRLFIFIAVISCHFWTDEKQFLTNWWLQFLTNWRLQFLTNWWLQFLTNWRLLFLPSKQVNCSRWTSNHSCWRTGH